ncbi:phenylalanine--tRNA ligase subunit alpha [Candidatus Woesebacteria bacterium]|nr:phenylalanine--tRNA ligase subunit alpha [Candidatus Woesebacteria bacterium]|tara:strand:+ start:121 stop:1149 length:1029 start_codon:yes stop_codon:yes gene_type:complete
MENRIQNLKNQALAQIIDADIEELEGLRTNYLGRRGELNKILREIQDLPAKKRPIIGQIVNDAKKAIERAIDEKHGKLQEGTGKTKWFDPTVPGNKPQIGHLHLVTQAVEEISKTFEKIGFVRVRYPEVEWDWFAFESLNMPKDHPARDEWETFFVGTPPHSKYGQMVLTPHTSSGQIREMTRVKNPPIRMLNIAKTYRRQSDVAHIPMFHQFEGLVVDKEISVVHLKGTLDYFARSFFGPKRKIRLRPFHFQFTEPSFEFDISCDICQGRGCKLCKAGWLELGGAGMVHPQVLKNGGIDPKHYTGFAFGAGLERSFMMKSGLKIDDVRTLYSSDLRFLRQF